MTGTDPRRAAEAAEVAGLGLSLVFCTRGGDSACGIPGPADESDLRAAHVLPVRSVVGLRTPKETAAHTAHRDGVDVEFLSQDVKRLCLALLKKNGQTIEQIHGEIVVATSPWHEELKPLSLACAGRHWATHYRSHARMLWSLGGSVRNVVRAARVLLTGAHLLRTGELVTDLRRLADAPVLDALEAGGAALDRAADPAEWSARHEAWQAGFENAVRETSLPPGSPDAARAALDDWLVRVRMAMGG